MDHFDDAWCPVCERAILPKRITVQVPVEVPAAPQPEPTPAPIVPRTRSSGGRPRGLVHGTGRAKALAPLKRTATKDTAAPTPAAVPAPTVQMKTRTVIDQSPAPLYCSDECRMVDLHRLDGGLQYNTNPFRQPFDYRQGSLLPLSPTRKDSSTSEAESTVSDTDSSIASSVAQSHAFALSYAEMSPSIGKLAEMYNFPALPAPLPCFTRNAKASTASLPAARCVSSPVPLKAAVPQSASAPVVPTPKKALSPSERYTANLSKKPVALDTSIDHAMRDTIIPVAYPNNYSTVRGTSRHASASSSSRPSTVRTSSMPPRSRGPSALEAVYGPNCPLLDTSREAARAAMFPGPSSLPSAPIPRRESILTAAQGKLLVPNVTLKRKTSSSSLASVGLGMKSPMSPNVPRRGSSISSDAIPEELEQQPDTLASGPFPRRSSPDDREPFMYDVQPWTEIVLRKEYRYTKGVEHEVEVPVRVPKYVSSLCLGPDGKDPRYEARRERERKVEASLKVEELRREAEFAAVERAKETSMQLRRNLAALVAA